MTTFQDQQRKAAGKAGAAIEQRQLDDILRRELDVVDWTQSNFYIPDTKEPIKLLPNQQAVLRYALRRLRPDDPRIQMFPSLDVRLGHFPFRTVLWSTPKKRGKSTVAGAVGRYIAETQTRFGEISHCANDLEQAKERSFKFIADSIRLTPNCVQKGGDWVLPERWVVQKTRQECLSSGSIIKAISTDARGEAGGNPDLTIWCTPVETPVLRADLSWVPASSLRPGDKVVSFEEQPSKPRVSRKFLTGTVRANAMQTLPCMEIHFADGSQSLRATPQHQWLVRRRGQNAVFWKRTDELDEQDELGQIFPVWDKDNSWDGGYVAGALDGEGSLSVVHSRGAAAAYSMSLPQLVGKHLLEKVEEVWEQAGIKFNRVIEDNGRAARLRVDRKESLVRTLGMYRPMRLLEKFSPDNLGHVRAYQWRAVTSVKSCLPESMACIATDVKTYIAAGYGAHNTEIWGFVHIDDIRFWEEMKPVPAKPDSMRWVETYAGFENESTLLWELYELGLEGQQLTAGQLAEATDTPLDAFAETKGQPDALVPVYVNEAAGVLMYWDEGIEARRLLPHEKPKIVAAYYREEEQKNTPAEYARHHMNKWVGAESDFIPMPLWDACAEPWDVSTEKGLPPFEPGDPTMVVIGVDAATTGDCFGIAAVTRHPQRHDDVAVRAVRKWDPKDEGGIIDYWGPENFLRTLCKGGCALGHYQADGWRLDKAGAEKLQRPICAACENKMLVPAYKVVQICYDSYQLVDMMQRLTREHLAWCEPVDQGKERAQADRGLYDLIVNQQFAHDGNLELREHIQNSRMRLQRDEDSKMRIVKKAAHRKIDLVVCVSMAAYRCKYLLL